LEEAIRQCGNTERLFICGGAVLYDYALKHDLIDIMYVTNIYLFDDSFKKQLQATKNTNTYLQYNFDNDKWRKYAIPYAENLLPPENENIKAFFYKYVRLR
jgi:dihydrofolate reductase